METKRALQKLGKALNRPYKSLTFRTKTLVSTLLCIFSPKQGGIGTLNQKAELLIRICFECLCIVTGLLMNYFLLPGQVMEEQPRAVAQEIRSKCS